MGRASYRGSAPPLSLAPTNTSRTGFFMHTTDTARADTTTTVSDADAQQPPTQPSGKPGWPRWTITALAWLTKTTTNVRRFVATDPAGAASLVGTAIGGTLTVLLVFNALIKVVRWLVAGHPAQDIATAVPALRIATEPIGHWLAAHTAGLPITTQAAAWTWGVTGFLLFYSATCRHLGAQLLWPVYGAATAAMAWFGTDTTAHRPVAIGLIAVAWSGLSLLALRGRRTERGRGKKRQS
jgi:hypothetical protein